MMGKDDDLTMTLGNLLALLIAVAGGSLALRLRIPAGGMVGALVGVIVFNVATGMVSFPPEARVLTQILAGGFIGMSITREIIRSLRSLIGPAILLCLSMLVMGLLVGFLLYSFSGFNLATCLLAAAPGGMTDVTLVAADMGGELSRVVTMHIARLVSVICICPALNRLILKRFYTKPQAGRAVELPQEVHSVKPPSVYPANSLWYEKARWLVGKNALTILVASAGGLVGYSLGIPAGVLVFSMSAVGAMNVATGRGYMSRPVRRFAQMIAGAMIAQNIGMGELQGLKEIILPAVVLIVCYILGSQLIAWLMCRWFHLDAMTALFSATPAGASDMALIAADLGGNSPVIAMLHVARLVSVIALFPQITWLILRLQGG